MWWWGVRFYVCGGLGAGFGCVSGPGRFDAAGEEFETLPAPAGLRTEQTCVKEMLSGGGGGVRLSPVIVRGLPRWSWLLRKMDLRAFVWTTAG